MRDRRSLQCGVYAAGPRCATAGEYRVDLDGNLSKGSRMAPRGNFHSPAGDLREVIHAAKMPIELASLEAALDKDRRQP
ncbi:hypothetical protein [Mesorhizobium sp. WSM3862]|uniref:hypothetical protein n=1 Tax=Mesorhizobium sp. WSM3862 TaxID=632858 RepID=UPI001FE08C8C|nr:hypothetical protein [Mesorhizobium sp. WSM3862]